MITQSAYPHFTESSYSQVTFQTEYILYTHKENTYIKY